MAFNQDMKNQKANLPTAAHRESLKTIRERNSAGAKFLTGAEVTKEMYFQNEGIARIRVPKGLQGNSGVKLNEIITVVERNARKGERNGT